MPPRIPDDKRAAILADIQVGKPRNQTAREHGVSSSTVTLIARDANLGDAFDRSKTKKAVEAAEVDHRQRLVKIAGRSAGIASNILLSFEEMTTDDWSSVSPHSRGIVLGILADKARELAPADDDGVDKARSMLGQLADGLKEIARQAD